MDDLPQNLPQTTDQTGVADWDVGQGWAVSMAVERLREGVEEGAREGDCRVSTWPSFEEGALRHRALCSLVKLSQLSARYSEVESGDVGGAPCRPPHFSKTAHPDCSILPCPSCLVC